MDKVRGDMETLSSMQLTKDMAGMDAESKELLRNKAVLAFTVIPFDGDDRL